MASDFRLKDQLPNITDQIVQTYDDLGTINHLDHCPLPSYEEVVAAVHDLTELIYPGYRRREGLHRGNINYYVGDLVDRLHDRLTNQIGRALRHEAGATSDCDGNADYEALGQTKTLQFLERLPALRHVLASDVQAAYDGDPACKNLDEVIFCYPGLEAITVFRLAHLLHELEIPFIPRMMTEWAHNRTGIDIHPGAPIGGHFFIEFGRLNPRHPHTWNFVDQPVVNTRMLGGDGLRTPGFRLSWLAPLPWYTDFKVGVHNANGETAFSFLSAPGGDDGGEERTKFAGHPLVEREVDSVDDLLYTFRWLNSLDLTETTTANLGVSALFGPNATGDDTRTEIWGGDLYLKWKPLRNYRGWPFVAVQSEVMFRRYEAGGVVAAEQNRPPEVLRDW
ncbi:MAG: hypothetical protein IH898_11300, partial [Planctomycetes bacterium]|nr:hypothetical protein [Planctomycetota bacterium]